MDLPRSTPPRLRPPPALARRTAERIRDPFAAFPRRRLWLLALTLRGPSGPKR